MSPAFHPLDTTLVIDILGLGGVTGGGGTISGRGTNTGSGTTSSSTTVRSVSAGLSINSGRNLDCISAKLITTLALPVEPPKNEEIVSCPVPCNPERVVPDASISALPSLLTKISVVASGIINPEPPPPP